MKALWGEQREKGNTGVASTPMGFPGYGTQMVLEWICPSWAAQDGTAESGDAGGPVVLPALRIRDCQGDFKPFCIVGVWGFVGFFCLYLLFYCI